MAAKGVEGRAAFGDAMALLGGLFGAAIGLAATLSARDPAMAFRGLLFAVAGTLVGIFVLKSAFAPDGPFAADGLYMVGPIRVAAVADRLELTFPARNLDLPWTRYGRLRPPHTSAVLFAFGANVWLATSSYIIERSYPARLAGRWAPWVWGYQLFIAVGGTGYGLGITQALRQPWRCDADDKLGFLQRSFIETGGDEALRHDRRGGRAAVPVRCADHGLQHLAHRARRRARRRLRAGPGAWGRDAAHRILPAHSPGAFSRRGARERGGARAPAHGRG